MKNKFKNVISGKCSDGKLLFSGEFIFDLFDTYGLPLDVIFFLVKEKNGMVDWISFIEIATKRKWNNKTIYLRLKDNVLDIWGKDDGNEILKRIDFYLKLRMKQL